MPLVPVTACRGQAPWTPPVHMFHPSFCTHALSQFLHTCFIPVPVNISHPKSEHVFDLSSGASHINFIFCKYGTSLSALSHPPGAYHSLSEANLLIPPIYTHVESHLWYTSHQILAIFTKYISYFMSVQMWQYLWQIS